MKILNRFLVAVAVAGTSISLLSASVVTAQAESWDDYDIHQSCVFDVDVIGDNGGFIHKGCYSDFESAQAAMYELGDDAVVRNESSLSPTKIIAMVNGIVISNPYRSGSSLSYYYMNSDFTGSNTYSQQYMQSQYHGTDWYSNGTGAVSITMNGFEGYIKLNECDLVPIKYFEDNLPIKLGGNNDEDPVYTIYPRMNYYSVSTDSSGNKEMKFYSFWGWSNSASVASQTYATPNRKGTVLPAADWMVEGTTYYSYNGYDFYTDMAMSQYAGTYYNYYQFLPLRTTSNLTASDLQSFLNQSGYASTSVMNGNAQAFIDGQNTYGVNALLVYAMAIHESAYGTSYYARTRANLFGWNAVDSNTDLASTYESVYTAVTQHMGTNLNGYLDIDDGRHFGMAVGNKGNGLNVCYASDAYWGISIASYAYQIDKAAGFKDLNSVTLGVVKSDSSVYFTKNSSTNTKWYDLANPGGSTYGGYLAKAYLVPILSEENGKYKTQTSDILTNGALTRASSSNGMSYDFETNVAWIDSDWITVLSNGTPVSNTDNEPTIEPSEDPADEVIDDTDNTDNSSTIKDMDNATYDLMRGVDSISYDETNAVVTISGLAFFSGANAQLGEVQDQLILVNIETGEQTVIDASNTNYDNQMVSLYEGYVAVGFEASIDLQNLSPGNYYLQIKVTNGEHESTKTLFSNSFEDSYSTSDEYGYVTSIFASPINSYRLEISCEKQSLEITDINRSSRMTPYFDAGTVSIENGHLIMTDGFSILRNANQSESDHPEFTIYLEDEEGNVTAYPVSAKASTYDFATLLKSSYDLSMASFDADIDLTNLVNGTYRIYFEIKTDTYHDYFEIFNLREDSTSETVSDKTYTFKSTQVRQRYVLTIE